MALSALTIANTLPYFSLRDNFAFFVEKGALARDLLWRSAFYLHVGGGALCLAVGPWLFRDALLRRRPGLHRALGRVYALAVLGCAGPAGLFMAVQARGGAAGALGFLLLGLLWWGETALGVRDAVRGRLAEHRRWMVRSYATALSAIFFRIFQVLLLPLDLDYDATYVASLWLSLAASLAAGEGSLRRPPPRRDVQTVEARP